MSLKLESKLTRSDSQLTDLHTHRQRPLFFAFLISVTSFSNVMSENKLSKENKLREAPP